MTVSYSDHKLVFKSSKEITCPIIGLPSALWAICIQFPHTGYVGQFKYVGKFNVNGYYRDTTFGTPPTSSVK